MRRSCGHTQAHCLHGVGCYFGESGLQKAPGQHKGSTRKPGKYQQRSSVEWPSPSPLYACWWCRGWTRDPAPRGPHQVTFWNTAWELWPGDVSNGLKGQGPCGSCWSQRQNLLGAFLVPTQPCLQHIPAALRRLVAFAMRQLKAEQVIGIDASASLQLLAATGRMGHSQRPGSAAGSADGSLPLLLPTGRGRSCALLYGTQHLPCCVAPPPLEEAGHAAQEEGGSPRHVSGAAVCMGHRGCCRAPAASKGSLSSLPDQVLYLESSTGKGSILGGVVA